MSSLEVLDRAVQAAVGVELGDRIEDSAMLAELGIAPQRRRSVAGLSIVSNAARDADVDAEAAQLADRLMRFRADKTLVEQKLRMHEVMPIAVLPLTAWDQLCNRTKLFRFSPKDNAVRISASIMEGATQKTREAEDPLAAARYKQQRRVHLPIGLAGITVGIAWLAGFLPYGGLGFVLAAANFITWGLRALGVEDGSFLGPRKDREATMIRDLVKQYQEDESLFIHLWPGYKEPENSKQGRELKVHIALPTPPPEIEQKLIRAERARLPLHIAVVGEAIALRDDVASIFIGERTRQLTEMTWARFLSDPIVYVIEGSAVAVLAQFGNFPIEHEVMREVINSVCLA